MENGLNGTIEAGGNAAPDKSDIDAIQNRYRAERDKRLAAANVGQYVSPDGALARYVDDPYVERRFDRAAVAEEVEVAIIGAGFGGLQAAAELIKSGISDFRIIDKAGDFGGVWYWNRYPGASCDIESYIYMPMLEDMGYTPSLKYARGPEIFDYARSIAEKFGLYDKALLQTQVERLNWVEADHRWLISTREGDRIRARFVMVATGVLQSVRLPAIPGIETFRGHSFHTSRWDYGYTGGDPAGKLTGLADKRVGIIGTGATAVQCIPHLGASAGQLYVFQRTPAAVPVRDNRTTDDGWAAALKPGWQHERMNNFDHIINGRPTTVDLVQDGWTEVLGQIGVDLTGINDADERRRVADIAFMNNVRARVDAVVKDPATAEALKPWFNIMCKRPCFHDEYLDTFNRPNVTLVDTNGQGVERISENEIWVGGKAYELDCLIYASGFDFQTPDMAKRNGFDLFGRGGISLTEKWQGGMKTYFGHFNAGFPNLFVQTATQGGLTSNVTHGLGELARHFVHMVTYCHEHGVRSFDATPQAEDMWQEKLRAAAGARRQYDIECTPGYYNNDGNPDADTGLQAFYQGGSVEFFEILEAWRNDGRFEGFELAHG
ncbi:monooxygenase [Sphingopyxis lindanitolerans]|uniref:Monooxygenase n=1 Tax=Sphingopyxis lindanitolerans TaxID=2054227 RepID=A0A2S8B408_9SPHN|nr:NAD(P)/FAD-dependent oxidoreductase [Sphingopyxis lindanitolerans]PQM27097.1 monooxygenase [Sphingopyxis lindanitolerans]